MIPSDPEVMSFAREELVAAQAVWDRETRYARTALRCCDLRASSTRIHEAFRQFADAYGYLRGSRAVSGGEAAASMLKQMRLAEREVDLGLLDISFVAFSRSLDLLVGSGRLNVLSDAMQLSAKPYRRLACELGRST